MHYFTPFFKNTFYYIFTQNHIDPLFRTVSRGSRVPRGGSRVPQGPFSEGLRKFEKLFDYFATTCLISFSVLLVFYYFLVTIASIHCFVLFPGVPGSPGEVPGSPRVRSQKVEEC